MGLNISTAEQDKALVAEHFHYMRKGEYLKAIERFAEDMVWWVLGTQKHGGSQTKADLIALYCGELAEYLPNGIHVVIDRMIAEDGWVAVQGHVVDDISEFGLTNANDYCWLFHIQDGEVKEFREYLDTYRARQAYGGENI